MPDEVNGPLESSMCGPKPMAVSLYAWQRPDEIVLPTCGEIYSKHFASRAVETNIASLPPLERSIALGLLLQISRLTYRWLSSLDPSSIYLHHKDTRH
jgi:hypothetical protein